MSSLAKITEKSRTLLKFCAIILAILFGIYILFTIGGFIMNIVNPPPPIMPEQAFGELPGLKFTPPTGNITYQINTTNGRLPILPSKMYVYRIAQPKSDLLAIQNSRIIVGNAGFTDQEIVISENVYQWTNPNFTHNPSIQYDTVTKNFTIQSNYLAFPNILTNSGFPDEDRIRQHVAEFLTTLKVNQTSLEFDPNIQYFTVNGPTLTPLDSIFNAKIARINLNHKPIQNELSKTPFPFVYPEPDISLTSLLISYPSRSRVAILQGEVYAYTILLDDFSDYPIKTAEEAFEELKNGNGYLYNPTNKTDIQFTNVYLAYYLDKTTSEYVQPVVVFEGADVVAYISAVKYIQSAAPISE